MRGGKRLRHKLTGPQSTIALDTLVEILQRAGKRRDGVELTVDGMEHVQTVSFLAEELLEPFHIMELGRVCYETEITSIELHAFHRLSWPH